MVVFRFSARVAPAPPPLPYLCADVCSHVATFVDPLGWGEGRYETLLRVLLLLAAWPETTRDKLYELYQLSRPYECLNLGYASLGFGYGVICTVRVLERTTFCVGEREYAAGEGDTVERCVDTELLYHNGVRVCGSQDALTYFRRGSFKLVTVETILGLGGGALT